MSEARLIRCFIAVELPEEIKARIERDTAFLRRSRAEEKVKWVPAENLHFTIKFLGGVPEEDIPGLIGALKEAVSGIKPFEIEVAGAGVFPGARSPRVFWIGAKDPESRFKDLAKQVEDALEHFSSGYPREEKGFTPHLTLGRLREGARLKGRAGMAEAQKLADELATLKDALFGKIKLENISLMRSELGPKGSKYSRLAEIRFGKD
ncbi:MAG: RNA 2',3'-cyclic phosphodiesterase [Nitrospiraceae bacterium]|nr:RNA 2',3'-cyclic phosphodiesterase [Nitrospiraceae bacterium]